MSDSLPEPRRPRWQPLRLGVVELYHYDEEELHFHDGRLLLRGNNGTGKSKLLALTVPFLLDAQLTPARLEPDGDPAKRMEWNLLLNGRYAERIGYSWLELGRVGDDGACEYRTLGCGLRAVHGRGIADRWFFVTPQRPGHELALVEREHPLTKDRLAERLGESGELFEQAERYRRAVDEALFGLGERRYRALVDLLVQLRQPQLSRRPDEEKLSAALTEALPPPDRNVLSDLAESLGELDAERDALEGLRRSAEALDAFLRHYRRYAAVAARRTGRRVREAQSAYERIGAELREAREGLEAARAEGERLEEAASAARKRITDAEARLRALRESPAMRDAERLHEKESTLAERQAEAERARAEAQRLAEERDEAERRLAAHRDRAERTRGRVGEIDDALRRAGAEAGVAARVAECLDPLGLPDGPGDRGALEKPFAAADAAIARRREAVDHLRADNRRLAEATRERERRAAERDREAEDLDRAKSAIAEGEQAVADEAERHVAAWRRALEEAEELAVADPEAILAELADWARTLADRHPAERAAEAARAERERALGREHERIAAEREAIAAEIAETDAERERLEAGGETAPEPPPWRDPAAREGIGGAPLWRVTDFRDHVDEAERAGLEAALEASGLLDAWVLPDGAVVGPDHLDTVLPARGEADDPAPDGRSLGEALVPAIDASDPAAGALDEATVAAVLARIALDDPAAPVGVSVAGRYRLGPAEGRWRRDAAVHIGEGAREAHRRRRLAELAERLDEQRRRLAERDEALAAVAARQRRLQAEHDALPDIRGLRDAHAQLQHHHAQRREAEDRLARATEAADAARAAEDRAREKRDADAADLALPAEEDALEAVAGGLDDAARHVGSLKDVLPHHLDNRDTEAESERALERSRASAEAAEARAGEREERARSLATELEALRAAVGTEVAELERRVAEEEETAGTARQALEETQTAQRESAERVGALSSRVEDAERRQAEADDERRAAVEAFRAFAADGLLEAAAPDLEAPDPAEAWAVDPSVRLARRLEEELASVDASDDAWERERDRVLDRVNELQTGLSAEGHQVQAETRASGVLVRIHFHGRAFTPDALAAHLLEERQERERLLSEKERQILENHLINEVARHLQQLISDAEERSAAINGELERRPTSTGMRLRLRWQPRPEGEGTDVPAGLAAARDRLLRQTADAWSAEDRDAVGRFLKEQIDRVRESESGRPLIEQLEHALDYRGWHRFRIERYQDGAWRSARDPASGGERALTVTLPLFAAASSYYAGAETAPRLIALDEAFAGVDDDARAACMGVLAEFDLDLVMTSEREWGCYREVPGLAIAQLARIDGIDAVHVTRWQWDGERRVEVADPRAARGAEAPAPEDDGDGLF